MNIQLSIQDSIGCHDNKHRLNLLHHRLNRNVKSRRVLEEAFASTNCPNTNLPQALWLVSCISRPFRHSAERIYPNSSLEVQNIHRNHSWFRFCHKSFDRTRNGICSWANRCSIREIMYFRSQAAFPCWISLCESSTDYTGKDFALVLT